MNLTQEQIKNRTCKYCGDKQTCWYCGWCPNMRGINNKGEEALIAHDCKDYLEV